MRESHVAHMSRHVYNNAELIITMIRIIAITCAHTYSTTICKLVMPQKMPINCRICLNLSSYKPLFSVISKKDELIFQFLKLLLWSSRTVLFGKKDRNQPRKIENNYSTTRTRDRLCAFTPNSSSVHILKNVRPP